MSQFQCQLYAIPIQLKCNGVINCVPDGSDEQDCSEIISIPSIEPPPKQGRYIFSSKGQ